MTPDEQRRLAQAEAQVANLTHRLDDAEVAVEHLATWLSSVEQELGSVRGTVAGHETQSRWRTEDLSVRRSLAILTLAAVALGALLTVAAVVAYQVLGWTL